MIARDVVRLKTGDKSKIEREEIIADGSSTVFKLNHDIITGNPSVWLDSSLQTVDSDYSVDSEYGKITFSTAPTDGQVVLVEYNWAVFSDIEVDYFLEEAGDNSTLASVKLLLALAADAAKLAMRETMAGGGGMGSVTRDTSLTAQELRETANVLYKQYSEESGASFPADGITEIIWTTHMDTRMVEEDFYRGG